MSANPNLSLTKNIKLNVSSRHPHITDRIRNLIATSDHNESTLTEEEYELYECADEVVFIGVSRHDQLQTVIEYEVDGFSAAHDNFVKALKGFASTSVRVLEEHQVNTR
jgi:hypothetical protein